MKTIIVIAVFVSVTVGGLMVFQGVSSDNSNLQNMNQINDLAKEVQSKERVQVFKDDAGTRRVLLGKGLNSFYGLKVSPEGVDVYDATDAQLIFNSNQNVFKIVQTGTTVISNPSVTNDFAESVSVTHGLGYIPAVVAYVVPPAGYASGIKNVPLPFFDYSLFDSFNAANIRGWHINGLADIVSLDTTTLTFRLSFVVNSASKVGNWTFKYYILQETAS